MSLRRLRFGVLCLLFGSFVSAWLGCANTQIREVELSPEPIAIVYWEPEDARKRAEAIAQERDPARQALRQGPARPGVARMEGLRGLVGAGAQPGIVPGRLALLDPLSKEVTRLRAAPPGARPLAWSEDRSRLLFLSQFLGQPLQLFEYEIETNEITPVTFGSNNHLAGDYGPGSRVAHVEVVADERSLESRVHVAQEGGRPAQVIPAGDNVVESLSWSPQGSPILWARLGTESARDGATRIPIPTLVARLADGSQRELGRGRHPSFTPDGEWVVYSARSGKTWRLRRMRPDGSGRQPVGEGRVEEGAPTVSPDGRLVVYVAGAPGQETLHMRRLDGTGDRAFFTNGLALWPVW